ncbi:uncharacterized protein MONBRDRAFT_13583 [Monosiga brevicollis MX1]|uniref:Vacuolar protein sorting-associated protein 45 n=1 Tax=Monosiga brevicollis TaxID=81824 RepID=A9UQW8_MONBE|nr:uncharacterized protein MONBRDRAFT_13583 [Monosiga brevicollis MX1]EDQ93117.1 predicted protein [Monosiga brevicollis MX1]|eukprot:XP_001742879.1 hypothetical protein [Monosiga brevicollis MX1]
MDVIKAVREYISKFLADSAGMKVLLLDEETTSIVSMVYSQTEILQQEVFLVERVDVPNREPMTHLRCIAFLRPTASSIDAMVTELRRPKYSQYDLVFTNALSPSQLDKLAQADEQETVRHVHEMYADYLAVDKHLFSFNLVGCAIEGGQSWNKGIFKRCVKGLLAVLLALKKRPAIRYAAGSQLCKKLGEELSYQIQQEAELFDFRQTADAQPLVLLLDRRDDPVTPCLNQWTYQAMVHELLTIQKNRVSLADVPGAPKEMPEVVLSSEADDFYTENMYSNFGEIGEAIRSLVEQFQSKTKSHENIESIEDMKAFVENYPQFRAMSGTVSKHVTIVTELSRLVEVRQLMNLSEAEQELACQGGHSESVTKIRELLADHRLSALDRLRLVVLYVLRHEKNPKNLDEFMEMMHRANVEPAQLQLVRAVTAYAGLGTSERQSDLFGTKGAAGLFKSMTGGLKGVDNIYTQHVPLLKATLDALAKNKLKDTAYPFCRGNQMDRPQDVFVFMVGGTTFEEARSVAQFNKENPTMRVVLGGTTVHNFESFCDEIRASSR